MIQFDEVCIDGRAGIVVACPGNQLVKLFLKALSNYIP